MNKLLAAFCLVLVSTAVLAQMPSNERHKSSRESASRVEIKTTANQMALGMRAAEAALTPAELAIAARVYQGRVPCELGAFVSLVADDRSPGYFDLQIKRLKYRMVPVETSTGAIRLEDPKAGVVWLQLANKSMLMNQKKGQRLADACMNPDQRVMDERLNKNPVPSILDTATEVAIK